MRPPIYSKIYCGGVEQNTGGAIVPLALTDAEPKYIILQASNIYQSA